MKIRPALVAGALALLAAAAFAPVQAAEKKDLTLETIFDTDTFQARLPRGVRWLDDGKRFTYIRNDPQSGRQTVYVHDLEKGKRRQLFDVDELEGLPEGQRISDFHWNADTGYALMRGPVHQTWQVYSEANWYVYNSADGSLWPLAEAGQRVRRAKLSPDGRHAGYVLDNDLYLVDLAARKTRAVTRDGSEHIFNGIFDYGSTEFGSTDAWRWAPDGEHIAFWRLDATDVPYYAMIDPLHQYPEVKRWHYPNAGETHAEYRVGVYSLDSGKTKWLETGHDRDDYLPEMTWGQDGKSVYIQWLTRDHQTLRVLHAAIGSGRVNTLLEETDPAWLEITGDLTPLADGGFLWSSEKSGFRHIYRYDAKGREKQLTSGDWSVDAVIGADADAGFVYFYAKKDSLVDQHVYRVSLEGGRLEKLTEAAGWHQWQLAPDTAHAVATYSNARTPPSMSIVAADGGAVKTLVEDSVPAFDDYAMPHTEFITFETDDGIRLNGFFIKPLDFDPDKQYPVIGYGYGNAGSQIVVNRWGTQRGPTQDLWHRYMAQHGYVIFAMDNRTTTGRGKEAKNLTYGEYGKYAVLDELQGVEYLDSLPWVDSSRLGFWGWSGGGYLAAALMTKGAPHFKVGVSVAPVIDLTRYQAVGVERWMGSPAENPGGYARVNLMNYADRLQGKLLLIHGTGDDNVKYDFTLQFAQSLIDAGKQFDMMLYPNQRHGITDHRLHVFTTITRYFEENL